MLLRVRYGPQALRQYSVTTASTATCATLPRSRRFVVLADGASEPKFFVVELNGALQALLAGDGGLPVEEFFGEGYVGAALSWVVWWKGGVDDFALAAAEFADFLGELQHCHFVGVADVYREVVVSVHQRHEAFDFVVNVAK